MRAYLVMLPRLAAAEAADAVTQARVGHSGGRYPRETAARIVSLWERRAAGEETEGRLPVAKPQTKAERQAMAQRMGFGYREVKRRGDHA